MLAILRKESAEVLYAEGLAFIGPAEIAELKSLAESNPRKRCRICTHAGPEAALHEMLIAHCRGTYIPPHKHLGKDESIYVVEGAATLITFTEDGEVKDVAALGQGEGRSVYCRLRDGLYHTLLIESDWFVFMETTQGPFRRGDTVFAPWAPKDDGDTAQNFMGRLQSSLPK